MVEQNVTPYIQFAHCFLMGLTAGMGYINIVYQLYQTPALNYSQIEMTLILVIFYANVGIFVQQLIGLIVLRLAG